ncbi:MAG TPA: hypothetical protein VHQ03_09210, partial [Candidatus Dormibacteraeota bacterium]|nr:hypothetical protein [Candidatus Dormibacteraeota bacterium]
ARSEFHFAAGPAVIAVAETVLSAGGVKSDFLRLFLQGFDTLTGSLRRIGYYVGLSLVNARDTIRVTLGSDSFRLTSGANAGYYLLAPGRAPYFYGSALKHGELQVAMTSWSTEFRLLEPPGPAPQAKAAVSTPTPTAGTAPDPCSTEPIFAASYRSLLRAHAARLRGRASADIEPAAHRLAFDSIERGKVTEGWRVSPGYRVGVFKRGPYAGYDLVFAIYVASPCKGLGCPESGARFAKRGQDVVYLRNLSSRCSWELDIAGFVRELGFRFSEDSSYTDPLYGYPETLTGPKPGQTIQLQGEAVYDVDSAGRPNVLHKYGGKHTVFDQSDVAFRDSALGDIYTQDTVTFVAFRPDGTALEYRYFPDIAGRAVRWGGDTLRVAIRHETPYGEQAAGSYVDAIDPCDFYPDVAVGVTNADRDLVPVGQIEGRGPLLVYRDSDAAFLRALFEGEAFKQEGISAQSLAPRPQSYHDFLASKPAFFWRDPFGRLERYVDGRYRPPCMAEPILYLYSEHRESVDVAVNIGGHIVASEPAYERGWHLEAAPGGLLTDLASGRQYAHLFWEGWSTFVRTPERGFVVATSELPSFFERILPKLGLSGREAGDFAAAWLPRLGGAPYYFITFLPPDEINRLAPLSVRPKPATIIRVFMDYRALRVPVPVIAPDLPPPPPRVGFTIVEWGGLTRQ